MINTNYWYHAQLRTIILHTLRIFQNFCISEGLDEDGNNILRRVPCVYMSTDKSVVYLLNNATDTVLETVPKMVLTISSIDLKNNEQSGAPYFEQEISVTEKRFNPEKGNYEYDTGNSYNIKRINPLPLGITFRLYVLTSMQDQKLQLFEQIRSIFSPTLELQTSENPLDWTRVTAITLTGLNWSSKGTTNLDSTTLDAMDMTFEVNTNLDLPSLVQKESIIEQVVNSIGDGNTIEDIMSWSLEDITRTYHSPTGNKVTVFVDDVTGKQMIKLEPSDKCKSWAELLKTYNINYDPLNKNVNINCLTNSNIDKRNDIVGYLYLNYETPNIAYFGIDETTLPETNIDDVNSIINPHDFNPVATVGIRYLITEDISNCQLWGEFIGLDGKKLTSKEHVNKNSIIEYTQDGWKVVLDPSVILGVYYLRSIDNPLYLYTYNNDYNIWVDVINKTYPVGFWRISVKNK